MGSRAPLLTRQVFASGVTSSDTNSQPDSIEVPMDNLHPLAPSIRLARPGIPRTRWRQLMDTLAAKPLDPRDQGGHRIR